MKVYIKTPSRLHFGILDLSGVLNRKYGATGQTINEPCFELTAEKSDRLEITGSEKHTERARNIVLQVAKIFDLPTDIKIRIFRGIPSHVGLSSTTQLTLAIGKALTYLCDRSVPIIDLAQRAGRGKNSGIGTYAFKSGGFIVDGGRKDGGFPPPIFRHDFPEEWRFVIATPDEKRGLDEESEEEFFEQIKAPVEIARKACHLLVMKMMPAIVERDINVFGEALSEMDKLVGEAFSPQQGGIYQSGVVSDIVEYMLEKGAYGAGQSSWGPTVYGLVENDVQGEGLKREVEGFLRKRNLSGEVCVVRPDNKGAKVETG